MAPSAVSGAPWGPSGARRSPKSSQKHTQRDPKETQGRALGAPGASQERPRVPKERPEGAPERSWEASGEAKSRRSRSPRRKKSILAKVLRDSALPMCGARWTPPDSSKIDPECSKVGSRAAWASSSVKFGRSRAAWAPSATDPDRLRTPKVPSKEISLIFHAFGTPQKVGIQAGRPVLPSR